MSSLLNLGRPLIRQAMQQNTRQIINPIRANKPYNASIVPVRNFMNSNQIDKASDFFFLVTTVNVSMLSGLMVIGFGKMIWDNCDKK